MLVGCIFSGSSLLWVAALGLIVIYNYAMGTFAFMPNEFDNQDEGEVVRYCDTLFLFGIIVDTFSELRDERVHKLNICLSYIVYSYNVFF